MRVFCAGVVAAPCGVERGRAGIVPRGGVGGQCGVGWLRVTPSAD
ncbi:MAG: hypothetical protein OXI71_00010 [Gemmatimonadota bacterium]|nr:hypothetical protein [Gemmatimonadota bacterium]